MAAPAHDPARLGKALETLRTMAERGKVPVLYKDPNYPEDGWFVEAAPGDPDGRTRVCMDAEVAVLRERGLVEYIEPIEVRWTEAPASEPPFLGYATALLTSEAGARWSR